MNQRKFSRIDLEASMKETLPRQVFTAEFRQQAVEMIEREGITIAEAARRLSISVKTLANWVGRAKRGTLPEATGPNAGGGGRRPVTDVEAELSRLRRENAELRMERDILKKSAAYFASESLRGTR
jgi:transposase